VHDVASKNGTFLNGSKLPGPMPLKSGDEIRLCDRKLVFICKTSAAQPANHGVTLSK
jgi:pSer/pThr/pTyr-binding forkhead associated (FHA) protein